MLTQYFVPEVGASQLRLAAMCRELRRMGHDVEVVTAMPNYPAGQIHPEYRNRFYLADVWEGIRVHRVWLYAATGSGLGRYLNYFSFALTCLYPLLWAARPDFIFVESPPLPLSVPAFIISRLRRTRFIFNVADLWPDLARTLGLVKPGLALTLAESLEAWSYRKAAYVCAVTEGIKATLLKTKGVPERKLLKLPNGIDPKLYRCLTPDVALQSEMGLQGKHVIIYAGTHGYSHGLERVLASAKLLSDDFHFLLVGSGSEKARLISLAVEWKLKNVTFLDPVTPEQIARMMSFALAGLVSLRDARVAEDARPAKTLAVMACGKPVLYIGKGEGARLVTEAKAGIVIERTSAEEVASAVQLLGNNTALAEELGRNGSLYATEHLSWSILIHAWLEQLRAADDASHVAITPSVTQPAVNLSGED